MRHRVDTSKHPRPKYALMQTRPQQPHEGYVQYSHCRAVPIIQASVSPSVMREVSVITSVTHATSRWRQALTNLGRLPGDIHSERHKAGGISLGGEERNSAERGIQT